MRLVEANLTVVLLALLSCWVAQSWAKENSSDIYENLKKFDDCIIKASFSNLHPANYPPTTTESLNKLCKVQADAIKCIKEKSKGTHSMVRRGMVAYVASRQKHQKKYCTNPNSEQSKKFVADMKCIREVNFESRRKLESDVALKIEQLAKKDLRDPALELRYLCCAVRDIKKGLLDGARRDCPRSMETYEEMISNVYPEEINLVCDDEEKLDKACSTLEPLKISGEFVPRPGNSPSVLALFIVSTLGEPNPPSIQI